MHAAEGTTTIGYSPAHRAAFAQYLDDPRVLRRLDDDALTSLLEDRNFADEVARERARRRQLVAPLPPPPARVVKAAPADAADDESDHWGALNAKYGAQNAKKGLVFSFAKTITAAVRELRHAMRDMVTSTDERLGRLESELAELRGQNAALQEQVQQLKASSGGVRWAGTYRAGKSYHEAELVRHAGGLWLACKDTGARPGQSPDFTLVCKSGAFADRGER